MNTDLSNVSDDHLQTEIDRLYAELHRRGTDRELLALKHLNIGGIMVADFVVHYGDPNGYAPDDEDYHPLFSFYVVRDGKELDIYYDTFEGCPVDEDDNSRLFEFVPPGFAEAVENGYEFSRNRGTTKQQGVEEAVAYLRGLGFRVEPAES